MKTIVLLFALAFAYVNCEVDSSSEEIIEDIAKYAKENWNVTLVHDILELKNEVVKKCPDLEEKLEVALKETVDIVSNIEEGSQTLCSLIRHNYMKAAKPLTTVVTDCLPEESKDLPVMFDKISLALVDTTCNSTVEELLELLNPCWEEKEFTEHDACKDIKTAFVEHRNKLPSKSLICSLLPKVKSCAKTHEVSCPNPITRKAFDQFYDAVEYAVADECPSLNKP